MSFASELTRAMPKQDVNGDEITFVKREDVFRLVWGVIGPVQERFVSVEHDPNIPSAKWLTHAEEIAAGRATLIADLNTDEGRAAFLQCWWPKDQDGTCVVWTAENHRHAEVPYPTHSQIRTAAIWLRPEPDLMQCIMRLGSWQATTTGLKALWDVGIRRLLWYPSDNLDKWLRDLGAGPRLQDVPKGHPYRTWTFSPGHTEEKSHVYYVDVSTRPVTDDYKAWLGGTP